jgi:hypothetical protein
MILFLTGHSFFGQDSWTAKHRRHGSCGRHRRLEWTIYSDYFFKRKIDNDNLSTISWSIIGSELADCCMQRPPYGKLVFYSPFLLLSHNNIVTTDLNIWSRLSWSRGKELDCRSCDRVWFIPISFCGVYFAIYSLYPYTLITCNWQGIEITRSGWFSDHYYIFSI